MIQYDRHSWLKTCFAWSGTVLPQVLVQVGFFTGLALALCVLHEFFPRELKLPHEDAAAAGLTVLGVALSMLIVFRTNSSNNRFWEARSLWGSLINTSRNLGRIGLWAASPADDLCRMITAYLVLVKDQLRDQPDLLLIRPLLPGRIISHLSNVTNPAATLAGYMSEWILAKHKEKKITDQMAVHMERLVEQMVDCQGGCEKIHRTPLPFVYASLIKQVLYAYLFALTIILVSRLHFIAPFIVGLLSLGLLGIEDAGVEIEDPFGFEPNHLPLDQICTMVAKDLADMAKKDAN